MRKVIDSNHLRSRNLEDFLRASPNNIAVLPDYIAWEAYKKSPVTTLESSLSILSKWPSQVIILKSMRRIVRQSFKIEGYIDRMIDTQQTQQFKRFCQILHRTAKGDPNYIKSI